MPSVDVCNLCVETEAILPSLEAFEMGIEIPSVYFLFYDYFLKACVGEGRWRSQCCESDNMSSPVGSALAEAFAMLQLKNNYFAWILEAKQKLKDNLITDYDPDTKKAGKRSAAEVYMKKMEFNLEGEEDEDLLIPEGHDKYNDLKRKTDDVLKRVRGVAKKNATYKEVKKTLESMLRAAGGREEQEGDDNDIDVEEMKRDKMKKRRKVLKQFREYTAQQGEEGRFKGWSKRAADDMAAYCKNLKKEKTELLRFRKAYREVYRSREQEKRKTPKSKEDVQVDYSQLWDVEDIPHTEI